MTKNRWKQISDPILALEVDAEISRCIAEGYAYNEIAEGLLLHKALSQYDITKDSVRQRCYRRLKIRSMIKGRPTRPHKVPTISLSPQFENEVPVEQSVPTPSERVPDRVVIDQIREALGRGPGKYVSLTPAIVQKITGRSPARVTRILGWLVEQNELAIFENPRNETIYLIRRHKVGDTTQAFHYNAGELLTLIHSRYIDITGAFLEEALTKQEKIVCANESLSEAALQLLIPAEFLSQLISLFASAMAIGIDSSNVVVGIKGKRKTPLTHSGLRAYFAIEHSFSKDLEDSESGESTTSSLRKLYQSHDQESRMLRIPIRLGKPQISRLDLTELRIGHQDFDYEMLETIITILEKRPDLRPDVIHISGIVQGGAQYSLKTRRQNVATGLKSERVQFAYAKQYIDRLVKLGALVIYNMSYEDMLIIESRTVQAIRSITEHHPKSKVAGNTVSWRDIDDAKMSGLWDPHLAFQTKVVFPYMLRSGRTLYPERMMLSLHNVPFDEYVLLLDAWQRLERGQALDPIHEETLEIDNVISITAKDVDRQRQTGLIICDNCIIEGVLQGGKIISQLNMNYLALSGISMPKDPTVSARNLTAQIKAAGGNAFDAVFLAKYHQTLGIKEGSNWVITTPGLHQTGFDRRGMHTGVSSDVSHRVKTTRREITQPGATGHTFTSDGRLIVRFLTKSLLDKCDSSTKRTAIALCIDWQTGSITARPDLQAAMLSYIFHDLAPQMPVALYFGGDIIHGRNYPAFANESSMMGLVRIDHQKDFVADMILNTLSQVPDAALANIISNKIVPGNHEWNSGGRNGDTAVTGTTHSDFLRYVFRIEYAKRGLKEVRPVIYEQALTGRGDRFHGWAGREDVAGYGIMLQHMFLEKGAKGATGPAIFQARSLLDGHGELMAKTDVVLTGHWHHPQYAVIGGKLFAISGSLAGLSGYEYQRGYLPVIGALVLFVGGGEAPELAVLSHEFLATLPMRGYFSKEHLEAIGFHDDPGHNPLMHGFIRSGQPQSALKKALWNMIAGINDSIHSQLP